MINKEVIVIGADGQDGTYLCKLLNGMEYHVHKITRENVRFLHPLIESIQPECIYNFAGISNVISPFENTNEIIEVHAKMPQQILETIVRVNKEIKYFQASSSLIFGRDKSGFQNEQTPYAPLYIYGAAKLYAQNVVKEFRETYGLFACSGIFFPHESPLRKEHFFSRKICKAAATKTKVNVGDLSAVRDYGYAKDYVKAAHMMLQAQQPKDYVIGTGVLTSLKDFAKKAFDYVGLNYKDYVIEDETLVRKNDSNILCADIREIKKDLGWEPKTDIFSLIKIMVDADRTI